MVKEMKGYIDPNTPGVREFFRGLAEEAGGTDLVVMTRENAARISEFRGDEPLWVVPLDVSDVIE